jgi:diguanylate cyclase (GGDEF)-like protein/PAS domain S-box-containing protein
MLVGQQALAQPGAAVQNGAAEPPLLRFAVLAFRPVPEMRERWEPVARYLGEKLPGHRVELLPLDYPELERAVREQRVDLVLTQPAHYVALSVLKHLYSPLATLVESEQGLALTEFGGVVVVKADHPTIRRLSDLRGQRIATSNRESLGGFQAQAFELLEIGIRLQAEQIVETGKQDAVITALQQGQADAGFVRTGLLEQMAKEGKLNLADFRILQAESTPGYPLLLSTRLYPQWALAAMPWLDQTTARQVAGAMLSLPHDGEIARQARISGFNIPGDYRSVDQLMRALRVPPFDARVPLLAVWEDHRPVVIVLGLLLLATPGWMVWSALRARRARLQNLEALFESERRFYDFADAASDWFWEMDADLRFSYFSERIGETLGIDATRLLGKTRQELMDPAERTSQHWQAHLSQLQQHLPFQDFEYSMHLPDGTVHFVCISGKPVFDAEGRFMGYRGIGYDITAQKEQQLRLEHFAHHDALTQLPNRVLLADRLQQAIHQAERRNAQVAVVYLDLDGFKAINDQNGHATGDQLLIELSNRLKQALREGDTLARLGGDEFVAVLLDLEDHGQSAAILDRLLHLSALPVQIDGREMRVSASLGVTFFPQKEPQDAEQLLRQADQAMYVAKQSGKNRYHIFDTDQDRAIRGRHESIERVREALEQREFVLHYQPKVNMRSGEVIGAEALIRWQHPEQGTLPPATFLPLIEDHDLIQSIGDWVIDTALAQMEAWQSQGLTLPVSVNVAGRQLQSPDFLPKLRASLQRHPTAAKMLEMEVLESSALEDIDQISKVISACQELGVGFDLDDFGTGYSSLTYLKRLPVQTLKIDQSFVRDMLDDADDLAILESIIGLAESFQRRTIAEGVEIEAQSHMLLRLGCDLGQGYAIARPMPAADIPIWVSSRPAHTGNAPRRVDRESLPVLTAMTEHRAWIKALSLHLHDRQAPPPALDMHQCRFGVWLDRSGARLHADHPALPQVVALHAAIHQRANELLRTLETESNTDEITRAGLADLEAMRDQLLGLLESLLEPGQEHQGSVLTVVEAA